MPDDLAPRGFYEGLTARYLLPGWTRREHPTGSKSEMLVHVWRADEARAALQEASRFVGTDIAERRKSPISNMPVGIINVLEKQQILDLLAYILCDGDADAASFREPPQGKYHD